MQIESTVDVKIGWRTLDIYNGKRRAGSMAGKGIGRNLAAPIRVLSTGATTILQRRPLFAIPKLSLLLDICFPGR
jgi:hypothetical protein